MSDDTPFEAFDRSWRLPMRSLQQAAIQQAAQGAAQAYADVSVRVEWEEDDTITCFFRVPAGAEQVGTRTVEVSVYDLGGDGRVLSLEADAADNDQVWEDACQLAEDMADALDGEDLDL